MDEHKRNAKNPWKTTSNMQKGYEDPQNYDRVNFFCAA